MTQTLAIFHDAYRSLNAKKMFWIVLVISGLVAGVFAFVGLNEEGLNVFFCQFDSENLNSRVISPALVYKWIFVNIGIGVWLAWIAAILALVSTASIFPDLISSGSVDLIVSKPIGRLRLFALQYVAGLLFVTLQVAIFSLASFLVIGLRGGVWEPGLFMAVPLVVCFFSYLFSVCVLLGVLTRSTLASLLLTLVFWFLVFGVGAAEHTLLTVKTAEERGVSLASAAADAAQAEQRAREGTEQASRPSASDAAEASAPAAGTDGSGALETAHGVLYAIKTVLPKTSETVALLERTLISMAELPEPPGQYSQEQAQLNREMQEIVRSRSVWWVVGTSLVFELVVLAWASLIFCRRDF